LALQQTNFIYILYSKTSWEKCFSTHWKIVKSQNPVPCVAWTASLGNEFFAKCELLSGKGRLRHELCLALLKGIDPSNQSVNQPWLIDWWINRSEKKTWNVYLAVCPLQPHDLNRRRKFGSKSKPFELLCCAQVKTFPFIISVISWCESWMCEWRKWEKANIWRQNFTFDRKLAFPQDTF